jgi:CPA1 family monovalent cation:H+ antiporter
VLWCAAIAGATIAIRLIWVPLALHVPHRIVRRWRKEPHASWKDTAIISWTAMRGIVSLALALGLPDDFPYRDLIVLFVFVVIAVTLIGQGLTLPLVIRAARFDNVNDHRQTREALLRANADALARLDEVAAALQTPPRVTEMVRTIYTRRCERLRATSDESAEGGSDGGRALRALRAQLIEVERAAIVELRDHGTISEEILQRLQNDLDLEALQPAR